VINDGPILTIGDVIVLGVTQQEEAALTSIDLQDETGTQLLLVDDNEWILGPPDVWDVQAQYQRLTIHAKARDIRLRLNLSTTPGTLRGRFWQEGQLVEVSQDGIRTADGLRMAELGFVSLPVRFDVNGGFTIGAGGGGWVVSEADPIVRYRKALNLYRGHVAGLIGPEAGADPSGPA
jgi:hypothetical protein